MEQTYISFKTAKLAKEKGFGKTLDHIYPNSYKTSGDDEPKLILNSQNNTKDDYVSAPTQSQLQRWLREEYGIHVWVGLPTDGFYEACVFRDKNNYYRKFDDFTTNETDFTTYESALEDGLFEALKLIK